MKEVQIGQEVVIADLGQTATVTARPDRNGMVEVRAGIMKTKVPLTNLRAPDKMEKRKPAEPRRSTRVQLDKSRKTSMELNLLHQVMGLAAGIFEFFLTLFDQVVAFLLGALQRVLRLIPGLLGLGLGVLQLDLQVIQLGQHAVEALIVVRHVIACGVDNFLRDAELGADEEGVRFARHADAQFIGGHQRFDVKLAAGVDDAGRSSA